VGVIVLNNILFRLKLLIFISITSMISITN